MIGKLASAVQNTNLAINKDDKNNILNILLITLISLFIFITYYITFAIHQKRPFTTAAYHK